MGRPPQECQSLVVPAAFTMTSMTPEQQNIDAVDAMVNQPSDAEAEEFKRVVDLLEFEIARIRTEESQPGWTTWALLGASATTAWLLTQEVENHRVELHITGYLFFVFYLTLAFIRMLHRLLSPPSTDLRSAYRFHLAHSRFSKTRTSMFFETIQSILLIFIVSRVGPVVSDTASTAAYIFLGIDTFAGLGTFILSFLRIPFTDYRTTRTRQLMPLAYLLLASVVVALVGFTEPIWERTLSPSVSEYRVAGLLFAITQLLLILAKREPNTPLLQTLIDLRRNLAFGKLELKEARQQAETALEGMTASDILQDELAMMLSHIEDINIQLEAGSKEILAFTSTISEGVPELSEEQRTLLMAVEQSVNTHISRIEEIQVRLLDRQKKLARRAGLLVGMSPEIRNVPVPAGERILSALKSVEVRKNQLSEQMRSLSARAHGPTDT